MDSAVYVAFNAKFKKVTGHNKNISEASHGPVAAVQLPSTSIYGHRTNVHTGVLIRFRPDRLILLQVHNPLDYC